MEILRARRQASNAAGPDPITAIASNQSARTVGVVELYLIGGRCR